MNNGFAVVLVLAILIGMGALLAFTASNKTVPDLTLPQNGFNTANQPTNQVTSITPPPAGPTFPPATELKIEDLKVGTGAEVSTGSSATVHYTGALTNLSVFDSSVPKNQPFTFKVGAGSVIKGWDEGLIGMKVGGKRRLIIPPSMGYGAQGAGGAIPPNATLIFDIDLLDVK